MTQDARKRWLAFAIVCVGTLMIVLDTTIVNVALPSIRTDLGFSETSLVWVVNAYMLTFGGCLLLGGRLGDLYGHRRLFVAGLAVFTIASLVCGVSTSQTVLVAARAVQGVGGAVVDAISLSLIMSLFTENDERAKAMGVYGFVCAAGGSIGVVLGGVLTHLLSWHWIFLVNVPIGILVAVCCFTVLPAVRATEQGGRLDVAGAVTITIALMLAVYAIVNGNEAGWGSTETVAMLVASVALVVAFVWIESRAPTPLMPLRLFRNRQMVAASVVGVLWAAAMFAMFFMSALYMQIVLGYDPKEVGLAFLPSNIVMAVFSIGISARVVVRYGFRGPTTFGMACVALGLVLFAFAPVDGRYWVHIFPGMLLFGVGAGLALNPVLMAAMSEASPAESGIASGIVNTSFMMGGALGLAGLAAIAAARTEGLAPADPTNLAALNAGYQAAFIVAAVLSVVATVVAWLFIRKGVPPAPDAALATSP